MADEISNNLFLINAPAGSGKTTTIYQTVQKIISEESTTAILCITYTRRAVEELRARLELNPVKIMTIHAFLWEFMKPYFSNSRIVDLYFEIYGEQIKNKIVDDTEKGEESRSWCRYVKKFNKLNFDTIKENVKFIYYNELEFNNLYYGGIGHDDLLSFSLNIIEKYPIIKTKMTECFRYIFIDEYQDTSANVLKLFYESVKGTETKLYLYGDRMQQIYDKYDGSFEEQFSHFDTSNKLRTNYRSSKKIVCVLNHLYNNKEYAQDIPKNKKASTDITPKLIITDNFKKQIMVQENLLQGNVLKLYITNQERFANMGAGNLYIQIDNLKNEEDEKIYGWDRKYSVSDVMTLEEDENPEPLFRLLLSIDKMLDYYKKKQYGNVIQMLRNRERKKDRFFQTVTLDIREHKDKIRLQKNLDKINEIYFQTTTATIGELLNCLNDLHVIRQAVLDMFSTAQYQEILQIPLKEFSGLCKGLGIREVSTQHGVKGEGHDKVFFIAEDNSHLGVDIYSFFKMKTEIDVEFQSFQKFYYEYQKEVENLKNMVSKDFLKSAEVYKEVIDEVRNHSKEIDEKFINNMYYQYLYKEFYDKSLNPKPTHKNIKEYVNINKANKMLLAYKLFYVSCSRAKTELYVFVSKDKIKNFRNEFINTFQKIGFEICEDGNCN